LEDIMRKRLCAVVLLCALAGASIFGDAAPPVFNVAGSELSDSEMKMVTGRLYIFGVRILPRLQRVSRRKRPSNAAKVHCDIIAQNKAESLGLDTSDQSGRAQNYNGITVDQIYGGYPNNRSATPPAGSSGYYFTSSGSGKEHMGAYSRPSGSSTYTRHMNQSFEGTEWSATVNSDYIPDSIASQRFVPLPRRSHEELYYR
jgi:hypothetical protein